MYVVVSSELVWSFQSHVGLYGTNMNMYRRTLSRVTDADVDLRVQRDRGCQERQEGSREKMINMIHMIIIAEEKLDLEQLAHHFKRKGRLISKTLEISKK